MKNTAYPIKSPADAAEYFRLVMESHPERNILNATLAAMAGKCRKHPCLYLAYLIRPDDPTTGMDELTLPEVERPDTAKGGLAKEIIQLLNPLKQLNPVIPILGIGKGTGTLVPSFGIPLDPELGDQPSCTLTFDEILALPEQDPETLGLMPEMRARIEFVKKTLPAGKGLYISGPDMQGPFNIAQAVAGEDILTGPYVAPEKFHKVMEKVTRLWIQSLKILRKWIGTEWLYPVSKQTVRIAECSVNLVSRETYEEFILPYDLKIAQTFGQPLLIHTCSGAHVFHATIENLPNVLFSEAGFIKCAVSGWTPVDEALEAIGNRPIVLTIGQEIWNNADAETVIKNDFDRYEKNPRLLFRYTQMEWKNEDKAKIRDIHRRCDEYWAKKYGGQND